MHWSQREKSPKIQADLLEINARVPEPSSLGINLLSDSEVIGMMYVAEGSMLGNRMIYKTLQNNQHIAPYSSFLFLNGYGSQTSRLWKEFLQVLSQNVEEKEFDTPTSPRVGRMKGCICITPNVEGLRGIHHDVCKGDRQQNPH